MKIEFTTESETPPESVMERCYDITANGVGIVRANQDSQLAMPWDAGWWIADGHLHMNGSAGAQGFGAANVTIPLAQAVGCYELECQPRNDAAYDEIATWFADHGYVVDGHLRPKRKPQLTGLPAAAVSDDRKAILQGLAHQAVWHGTDATYIRLPPELQVPISNCSCPYCKEHPDKPPMWDTLGVPHANDGLQTTWTLHWPDPPKMFGMHGPRLVPVPARA